LKGAVSWCRWKTRKRGCLEEQWLLKSKPSCALLTKSKSMILRTTEASSLHQLTI
jgi:hypothetical protein